MSQHAHRRGEQLNPSRRCIATARRTGEQCKQAAILGGNVCQKHGGSAPQVRRAADRRRAEAEALELGTRLALGREIHPLQALLDAVSTAAAMREVLERLVSELGGEGGAQLAGRNHLGDGAPHVYVVMLRDWTKTSIQASKAALDAGVDERRVRLAEVEGRDLASVVQAAVDACDPSPEQRAKAMAAAAARMRGTAA